MVKKVLYSVIGVAVLVIGSLIIVGSNLPQSKVVQNNATTPSPVVATTSAKQNAVVPDKQKVAAILSASVTYYTQLFAAGKATLGTTQYADANAGLKAFDDPNSAASRLGSFRTNTCLKNDPGANAIKAYQEADNLYLGTSPDALGNWNYDINTVASDICLWAGDAVSWQIKEIPATKLHADEQKIATDISRTRIDIKQILPQ
jgi:hypothetical protein